MTEETHEKIKKIKQSFRLFMDGITSTSMRKRGVDYKINWGIPLPRLKEMAKPYGKDYALAIELWKENIRECKILATHIMPEQEMDTDIVDVWFEQVQTQEIAEVLAFNLLRHVDFAPAIAFRFIASESSIKQICGYQLLACLFSDGKVPDERGINEFIDQAKVAFQSDEISLKHAVYSCIIKFCDLNESYDQLAQKAFADLDIL